jgi:preprotein translocase subunit YajC
MEFTDVIGWMAQAQQPSPAASALQLVGMFAFMGIVLYFLMIRPQQKKAREHTELVSSVKVGDKVLTSGGILAIVVGVKEKTLSIRSADTKLEILKSAVSEVTERAGGSSEK